MEEIKKEEIQKINEKPFGILLFYSDSCHHCKQIKPIFEKYSELYSEIKFAKIEIKEGLEYYNMYAEEEQAMKFEPLKDSEGNDIKDENGQIITQAVPQFKEDGTPLMMKKYAIPAFYVHHVDAITPENPYGFIGAFYGSLEDELKVVCEQIMNYGKQN